MDERPIDDDGLARETRGSGVSDEARLRAHWPDRVWRKSREGNWYLNAEGFNLAVSHRNGEWTVFIRNRETELGQAGRKSYPTLEAAKMAGFEALMWARRKL